LSDDAKSKKCQPPHFYPVRAKINSKDLKTMKLESKSILPQVIAYTADISICSQICRLAVYEHGLLNAEYINVDIEYAMDNYEPWFVRMQRKMTVPVLKYESEIVGDSRDIMLFLAEKHSEKGLYPNNKRSDIDSYINEFYSKFDSIGAFTFGNFAARGAKMRKFIVRGKGEVSRQKLQKLARDPEFKAVAEAKLQKMESFDLVKSLESLDLESLDKVMSELLDRMEQDLSDGRSFLIGTEYSLADVVGTAYCARIHFIKGTKLFGDRVKEYWQRMKSRLSFNGANVCSVWEDTLMSQQFAKFVKTLES